MAHEDRIPFDDLARMSLLRAMIAGKRVFDEQAQDLLRRGWIKLHRKEGVLHMWRVTRVGQRELALYERFLAEAS